METKSALPISKISFSGIKKINFIDLFIYFFKLTINDSACSAGSGGSAVY